MAISLNSLYALAALATGYLLGSIPFGLILTRFAGVGDLRAVGSGNIGATNVLRTGRKDLAVATLILDALKGTLAYLVAWATFHDETAALAGAAGAFLGHLYPVWLRFRGGKGVATFLGGLIAACPPAAIVFILVWLAVAAATRYSSLAALAASVAAPLAALAAGAVPVATLYALLTALLWLKHSDNIARLLAGTEPKIGRGAER